MSVGDAAVVMAALDVKVSQTRRDAGQVKAKAPASRRRHSDRPSDLKMKKRSPHNCNGIVEHIDARAALLAEMFFSEPAQKHIDRSEIAG